MTPNALAGKLLFLFCSQDWEWGPQAVQAILDFGEGLRKGMGIVVRCDPFKPNRRMFCETGFTPRIFRARSVGRMQIYPLMSSKDRTFDQ